MTWEIEKLACYNFLASKLGVTNFSSHSELEEAIINDTADKRCIPYFSYQMINADTFEVASTNWCARSRLEWLKTKDGKVTEHYRRFLLRGERRFENYDINTGELLEYYDYPDNDNKSIRKDLDGNQTQFTTFATYAELPEKYKSALVDYKLKEHIFGWSDRKYGRIVYVAVAENGCIGY